tara:strand:+ start:770 stop:1075 length:306 start_codon:yes stop_codon:yes gene_type:complete
MNYNFKVGDLVTDPRYTSIKIGVVVQVEEGYYEMGRLNNSQALDRCHIYWPSVKAYSHKPANSLRKIIRKLTKAICSSCEKEACECGWSTFAPWRETNQIK